MKHRIVSCAIALALALPATAATQQVVHNNGTPDNVDGLNVSNRITANDFTVTGSSVQIPGKKPRPSSGMVLNSFDWWVIHSGISPTVTSSFYWEILSDASGTPGSTVVASGQVDDAVGTYTTYGFSAFEPAYFFNVSLGNVSVGNGTYWLAITSYVSSVGQGPWYWATSAQTGNQHNRLPHEEWADNDTGTEGAFVIYGTPGVSTVPEPATLFLVGSGIAGIAGFQRRRKKTAA